MALRPLPRLPPPEKSANPHGICRQFQPSQSKAAIALVERLIVRVERYVRRIGNRARLRGAAAEHRRILADIERKNFISARSRMQEHILHTGEQIRKFFAKRGRRVSQRS